MKNSVNLTYVHPTTLEHVHSKYHTVEAMLLDVKALRRYFRKTYKVSLDAEYFQYSFVINGTWIRGGC